MRRCPRCKGQLLAQREAWECLQCGHEDVPGFVPVSAEPVRLLRRQPRPTARTVEEQERAYELRMARERIQQQRSRLRKKARQ